MLILTLDLMPSPLPSQPWFFFEKQYIVAPMSFAFEKLHAYQASLKWVSHADHVIAEIGQGASLRVIDQLSRAALSIPLNIAEGNGRWHKREKKQFFWIARGSAFECVAILQVLRERGLLKESAYEKGYAFLEEISRTLSGLIHAVDRRA